MAVDKMSVAAVVRALGLGWNTVNALAGALTRELVFDRPGHLDGVRYLGVDEHKWKHSHGQGEPDFVTVIVDLTPVIDGTGPARLLDITNARGSFRGGRAMRGACDNDELERVCVVRCGVDCEAQQSERAGRRER
ncbi:hypothetical protein [Rhodococcus sp. HNM0569]|uniref:hypothetical protein n=1 Tax=Rhodococcus sp. HNM0569 TaxID=2716340 RepID=UPI001F1138CF|nr:hypothetical protein [Rhodococcus sp. HNM0569]